MLVDETTKEDKELVTFESSVIFMNLDGGMVKTGLDIGRNEIYSVYKAEENADALYAFSVHKGCFLRKGDEYPVDYPLKEEGESDEVYSAQCWEYLRSQTEEYLLQNGFYLLDETVEDRIIFVGTLEHVQRVFAEDNDMDGWYVDVDSVAHPQKEIVGTEGDQIVYEVSLNGLK